jgi:hypothetical protein
VFSRAIPRSAIMAWKVERIT